MLFLLLRNPLCHRWRHFSLSLSLSISLSLYLSLGSHALAIAHTHPRTHSHHISDTRTHPPRCVAATKPPTILIETHWGYDTFDFDRTKEKPKLSMRIECYHMETRTSGSGKNRRTRRVKVVTWRGSREIQYATWYDQSQRPAGLDQFPVIKMLCKKTPITFADAHTEQHIAGQRRQFQNENRHRDRSMSFSEVYTLDTFKPNVLFKRSGVAAKCMQRRWYVCWTFLCCNWAYRYWFERASTRTTINISKVISIEGAFNPANNDLPAHEKASIKAQHANGEGSVKCFSWLAVVAIMVAASLLTRFFVFQNDPSL